MGRSQSAFHGTAAEKTAAAADEFGDEPTSETFAGVLGAVHDEWRENEYGPISGRNDESVLTPVGQAIKSAAAALDYDVASMIDFDDNDEITVEYESFDGGTETPHAVPTDIVRLVAYAADVEPGRTIWMEDGAGAVQVYVDRTPDGRQ